MKWYAPFSYPMYITAEDILKLPVHVKGPCMSNICTSLESAHHLLRIGSDQLVRQAHHLFQMYPDQEVLLIVAVGFWWLHCVLRRNESKIATQVEVEEAEYEEASMEADEIEAGEDMQGGVMDIIIGDDFSQNE